MSWQERMRQMVLAGGVAVAGCSSGQLTGPDAGGRGGAGGTPTGYGGSVTGGGTGGAAGAAGNNGAGGGGTGGGGTTGSGGTIFPIPCGNANPDPCICGRPDTSAVAAANCTQKRACESAGGVWSYFQPSCSINVDAGVDARRDAAGDGRDR